MDIKELVENLKETDLVYWRDSYARSFESEVLRISREGKKNVYIVLKSTVFHPKSGGQPADTGTITTVEGAKLIVRKVMAVNGVVAHYCAASEGDISQLTAGAVVRGEISWPERYSAMRKHTAGHLFDHCLEVATRRPSKTVDSWLGDPCYVTYDGPLPSQSTLDQAVTIEKEMIDESLMVRVDFVSYQRMLEIAGDAPNIARLPRSELMRIVTIEGCKSIPCGGTHVKNTKEIGKFELKKVEKEADTKAFRIYYAVE